MEWKRQFALVLIFSFTAHASSIPWWNIKLAQEQGPNVCVVEELPETSHRIWTECKYWNSRDICGQKPVIRYECCEGFKQVPGTQGCVGVKPLKNIVETAKDLGAKKFVKHLEDSGLISELANEGPFTLFAPTDEALQELGRDQRSRLDSYKGNPQNPVLLYHIVDGRVTSPHFKADLLLDTRYGGHKLRINKYSSRIETVNCAIIHRKDQEATNGVVHVIDSVLDPFYSISRDLAEIILQDGRFQELTKAMDLSGFMTRLRTSQQPMTILAPSDEAFQKITQQRLSRIMNDRVAREVWRHVSNSPSTNYHSYLTNCLAMEEFLSDIRFLLENHVLSHVMCIPALVGAHKVKTTGLEKLVFDCDKKGAKVNNKQLRPEHTLGNNGVLYVINDVLIPDRAKSLIQLAEDEKLSSFLELIQFTGLEDAFENFGEYTLFAPSEAAMFSLPSETLRELRNSQEKARKFVLYHATQGRIKTDKIRDNQVIMSLNEENPLRLQMYRALTKSGLMAGVEGAMIEVPDKEGINGVLHVINQALTPPKNSAGEVLRQNGTFNIFLDAMDKVTAANRNALDFSKAGTYFVPTDHAFNRLGHSKLQRMLSDTTQLTKLLKNHIADHIISSVSIQPDLQYSVPTGLSPLIITKKDGKLKVNDATVLQPDILNANGIIHVINKVLLPDI